MLAPLLIRRLSGFSITTQFTILSVSDAIVSALPSQRAFDIMCMRGLFSITTARSFSRTDPEGLMWEGRLQERSALYCFKRHRASGQKEKVAS